MNTDVPEIRAFLKKYEGERPAELLRADWIRAQAKQGNWALVAQQGALRDLAFPLDVGRA